MKWTWRSVEQKMADDLAKIPEVGTVPYYRYYERFYIVQVRWMVALLVTQTVLLSVLADEWWLRIFWVPNIIFVSFTLRRALDGRDDNRDQAWHIETRATLQAMSESGLYNAVETVEALRDGPMPSRSKRKAWKAAHEDMLEQVRKHGNP